MTATESFSARLLRALARAAVVLGAAGSLAAMLRVGHREGARIPLILLVCFTLWVLSPFVAFLWAELVAKRWSPPARAVFHGAMLFVALGSLALYWHVALSPPKPKPASWFLLVPLASWLLLAIAVPLAASVSRQRAP